METEKNINPQVEVRVPKISLRLEDLTYLRGLANPNGVHCHIPDNKLNRLKVLGLVEDKMIAPSGKDLEDRKNKLESIERKMQDAAKRSDWEWIYQGHWPWKDAQKALEPRLQTVLTATGALLLEKGEVHVRIKKGCA